MCEEKQDTSVFNALTVRHCSRLATTASTAAAAVAELDPLGPVGEQAQTDAGAVFDEVRYIFEALAKRSEGGLAAQAFPAVLKALRTCSAIRAAYNGEALVSREGTIHGLDRIIGERQEQIERLTGDCAEELAEVNLTTSAHGLAYALRTRSRELEALVLARDIISGG